MKKPLFKIIKGGKVTIKLPFPFALPKHPNHASYLANKADCVKSETEAYAPIPDMHND